MKTLAITLAAVGCAAAQINPALVRRPDPPPETAKVSPPPAAGSLGAGKHSPVSLQELSVLQLDFDRNLGAYGYPDDPIDIIGRTRGIYLKDYGAVFTVELSPIVAPAITPFHQKVTPEEVVRTHQRKIDRLPVLRGMMSQMIKTAATQLTRLPDDQQVVLLVKLLYLPYEDTSGLPGQIVMKGDKRSVLAGKVDVTED